MTRALDALRTMAQNMAADSGIDNPLESRKNNAFGKWKGLIASCLLPLAIFVAILVTCGCCFIPCFRTLLNRLITTALTKESMPNPPTYQMVLNGVDVFALDEMEVGEFVEDPQLIVHWGSSVIQYNMLKLVLIPNSIYIYITLCCLA